MAQKYLLSQYLFIAVSFYRNIFLSQYWVQKCIVGFSLYNVDIDPFDVDSRLPEPIDIQQSGNMFNVNVKMSNIKVSNDHYYLL